jgi:hypothetical protein
VILVGYPDHTAVKHTPVRAPCIDGDDLSLSPYSYCLVLLCSPSIAATMYF